MKNIKNENGFSLIELLIVVVIIGVIATIGVPIFRKGIIAAENGAIFAVTKIMAQEQVNFYSQNSRYARLDELNAKYAGGFGTLQGTEIKRGKYTFEMLSETGTVVVPTDDDLKKNFTIKATRTIDAVEVPYAVIMDASGNSTIDFSN